MRRGRWGFALLASGVLTLAASQPALGGTFHGVVTQADLQLADYERMRDGNVGTLRLRVSWDRVERTAGAPPQWAWLDEVVDRTARNGIRLLPEVEGTAPAGISTPPLDRRSRRAYARFAGALAARYGRGGSFWDAWTGGRAEPITAWQIWNEQNGRAYWGAKPSPRAYGKLVKAAARRIREADPRAEIVLGGMFGTPGGADSIHAGRYLRALYRVPGIKAAFDTVAIHPYSPTVRGLPKEEIRAFRRVMRRNGDRRAALRVTEFGWGSGSRQASIYNAGRRGQARLLRESFRWFERKRKVWKIKGVNWFSWADQSLVIICSFCPTSGLFTERREPKPAWHAFTRIAR